MLVFQPDSAAAASNPHWSILHSPTIRPCETHCHPKLDRTNSGSSQSSGSCRFVRMPPKQGYDIFWRDRDHRWMATIRDTSQASLDRIDSQNKSEMRLASWSPMVPTCPDLQPHAPDAYHARTPGFMLPLEDQR